MFAVVAPCLGPSSQVINLICIPHQIPMNFMGLIQLRLSMIREATICRKSSVQMTMRQGVEKGNSIYALVSVLFPSSNQGVR